MISKVEIDHSPPGRFSVLQRLRASAISVLCHKVVWYWDTRAYHSIQPTGGFSQARRKSFQCFGSELTALKGMQLVSVQMSSIGDSYDQGPRLKSLESRDRGIKISLA